MLSGFEVGPLVTFLRARGAADDVDYDVRAGPFGGLRSALDEIEDDGSPAVVLSTVEEALPEIGLRAGAIRDHTRLRELVACAPERLAEHVDWLLERLAGHSGPGLVVAAALAPPPWATGPLGAAIASLPQRLLVELVDRSAGMSGVTVLPPAVALGGLADSEARDDGLLLAAGCPWSAPAQDALAAAIHSALMPVSARKLLVTDLDRTLWQGLIGEDGPERISAHPEGHGWVHFALQRFLLLLRSEGVVLAVVSRNDAAVVREFLGSEPLRSAAGVRIGLEDFAAIECTWEAKSAAVGRVCEAMGLEPAAVVFLDDDPVERAEVARHCPGVECVAVPDAAGLRLTLQRLRDFFPLAPSSDEDRRRSELYASRERAERERAASRDPREFLRSLDMRARIVEFAAPEPGRPFQLLNRTNQFTLTGARYSEHGWRDLLAPESRSLVRLALEDRYGDHGIVLVAVIERAESEIRILELAMSCRVLNRGVELAFLDWLDASGPPGGRIVARFRDSGRNGLARAFVEGHAVGQMLEHEAMTVLEVAGVEHVIGVESAPLSEHAPLRA